MKKTRLAKLKAMIQQATDEKVMSVMHQYPNGVPADVVDGFRADAQAEVRNREGLE